MKKIKKSIDYTPHKVYTVNEPKVQGSHGL